jgi:hypothetical protein
VKNASNAPKSGQGGEHALDPGARSGTLAFDRQVAFGAFFRRAETESNRNRPAAKPRVRPITRPRSRTPERF